MTNKTQQTTGDPAAYVAAIDDAGRRADCEALLDLMARASGQPPVMWGPAIVGFGTHRYPLSGGRIGTICAVGFSSRKGDLSLYGLVGDDGGGDRAMLARLGRHKLGKGCLHVRRLADIDTGVLEQMVRAAARARQADA